ncbi:hypothetical protein VRU48_10565 [Pedobacter sp. KR3-3]|uniref:DUF2768 domain-containing protein n=1 Tax=Pedobacter albus TaxID=3113905 RepID=A0ABU7I8K1_9SPHI|nr:hypothetical protein [Pedobacter sp. KR3-3]MEE1945549.1 hypothetical protein [Pedobacter sp. KR3-3]
MEGIIVLSLLYWAIAGILFLVGIIMLIARSSTDKPVKPGLRLIIIAAIMVVVGAGACALIIGGIGGIH